MTESYVDNDDATRTVTSNLTYKYNAKNYPIEMHSNFDREETTFVITTGLFRGFPSPTVHKPHAGSGQAFSYTSSLVPRCGLSAATPHPFSMSDFEIIGFLF